MMESGITTTTTTTSVNAAADVLIRRLCLLFPLTYLIHIFEELGGGEGFPAWLSKIADVELTPARFLTLNVIALSLMIVGSILISKIKALRWLLVSFGTVVLLNGLTHLIASCVTASYSPGLVSGLLLWVPLGAYTLHRMRHLLKRRRFWTGALIGVAMHGVVSIIALLGG